MRLLLTEWQKLQSYYLIIWVYNYGKKEINVILLTWYACMMNVYQYSQAQHTWKPYSHNYLCVCFFTMGLEVRLQFPFWLLLCPFLIQAGFESMWFESSRIRFVRLLITGSLSLMMCIIQEKFHHQQKTQIQSKFFKKVFYQDFSQHILVLHSIY